MTNKNLREAGLKATLPRTRILRILENAPKHHMTAEEVCIALKEGGDDVGIATVYRVLTQFEAAGLVKKHHFESGLAVFEIHHGEHHDHLICIECDSVTEFLDESLEKRLHQIADEQKFTITEHSLVLYGICKKCRGT